MRVEPSSDGRRRGALIGQRHTSTDAPLDPASRPGSSMPTGSSPKSVRRRTTISVCIGRRFSQDGTSPWNWTRGLPPRLR